MPYQFVPYNMLLLLSALITLALGIHGYRHRAAPGAKAFVAGMCIGFLWSAANALEISALTLEHKLFWANIQYIAYSLAPVAWITMVLQFTGKAGWINKRNIILLMIIPAITCFFVWTDQIFGLVRYDIYLDTSGSLPVIVKKYGPWFWVHFAQAYFLNFYSLFLLIKTVSSKNNIYRSQSVHLLIGTGLIAAFNLSYIFGISPVNRDISPLIFSVSGAVIAWGIFRFRLFNLVPIARNRVIEAMKNIVIVIDADDIVVDVNPAAAELLTAGKDRSLTGRPISALSKEIAALVNRGDLPVQREFHYIQAEQRRCSCYEIQISPIKDEKGALMGRVFVMNDISELKQAQEELHREQRELAVMAERDRLTKDLHDNLGQIFSFAGVQLQAAQLERRRGNLDVSDHYLERLGEIIEDAHQEMRNYVYNARIDEYRKNSIEDLIRNQITKFIELSGYFNRDDIVMNLADYGFSVEAKMHIVNIVKEGLNNILKHACATFVKISLYNGSGVCTLMIEDNGLGFISDNISHSKSTGSGLCIMDERARLLGGDMKIDSVPGKYTKIIVRFPDDLGGEKNENHDR